MIRAAILVAILTLALTPTATATTRINADPYSDDFFVDLTVAVSGEVKGGDGARTDIGDALRGVSDDDLICLVCGDENDVDCYLVCIKGHPEPSGTAERWVLDSPQLPPAEYGYPTTSEAPPNETFVTDDSPVVEHPYEVLQCPGADTPEYDPNNEACW